ncbi:MAG: MarR family winged helix-turn-helix transcriptional regulator [Verrucomicrobiota bacterium]
MRTVAGPDRRRTLLRLTPEGEALVAQAYPHWRKAQQQIVKGLGSAQWRQMRTRLDRVVKIAGSR